jgi:hypothetical protein
VAAQAAALVRYTDEKYGTAVGEVSPAAS